jgi:small nuclear ribonucleoprotein (snRNP)-like protein
MANTEKIQELTSYLNFKARIKITDGRTFIGTFVCIDKEKNIILAHTEEFRSSKVFFFLYI